MARARGPQDLLDRLQEAVAVGEHDVVELIALGCGDITGLEGFEVEANGSQRRLQFVRDGVDESVVLFVASDLTNQEGRVEDEADDDEHE